MGNNTTSTGNSTCDVEDTVEHDDVTIENVTSILTLVICPIGIILNILNIVIATRKPSKGSLHVYLVTLSVVDALYLACVLPSRAFRCGDGCNKPALAAKIYEKFVYLAIANTLVVIDAYITVTWAIHRLVYIHKPRVITNHSSLPLKAAIIASVTSAVVHLPYFFKWRIVDGEIQPTQFSRSKYDLYYTTGLMALTRALPILTLFITNILLIKSVNDAMKRRKLLAFRPSKQAQDSYQQTRLTILLISVICLMIIGNTPVVLAHEPISEILYGLYDECLQKSLSYREFRAVANLLEQVSFSLNFVIYYSMNNNFKEFTHKTLRCKCRPRNAISEAATATSM